VLQRLRARVRPSGKRHLVLVAARSDEDQPRRGISRLVGRLLAGSTSQPLGDVAARARVVRAVLNTPPDVRRALVAYERNTTMIKLHHSREERELWVNADLIETIESTPDTVVRMTTGRTLLVRETPEEIAALVMELKRRAFNRPHVLGDR
jgi:flagellar protein FlbD